MISSEIKHRLESLQILTSKVHPRTKRLKIFLIAVDPSRRYSNEAERDN